MKARDTPLTPQELAIAQAARDAVSVFWRTMREHEDCPGSTSIICGDALRHIDGILSRGKVNG